MMTERDLLLDRVDLLLRSLGRAEVALNRTMPEPADPVTKLKEQMARNSLQAEFKRGIGECRGILKEASTKVKSEASLADCWPLYGQARDQAEALFGEVLAFRVGALMRAEKLDDGLFPIADELVWELASGVEKSSPITILAESEYIGHRARIIRLRYPAASVWDLPVVAHEFGHVVAQEKDMKVGTKLSEEHIADIFATYALGPAFACTMILHRFDPSNAHPEIEWTHPGDVKRVYCILETLWKMEDSRGWVKWRPWVDEMVNKPWEASLAAVGQRTDLDGNVVEELDRLLEKVLGLFKGSPTQNVKYANENWNRAHVLADHLGQEEPPESALDENDTVRDLLNAAWCCRIEQAENSDQVRAISDRVIEWCRALFKMRNTNHD